MISLTNMTNTELKKFAETELPLITEPLRSLIAELVDRVPKSDHSHGDRGTLPRRTYIRQVIS
jgi:hypothetical protein